MVSNISPLCNRILVQSDTEVPGPLYELIIYQTILIYPVLIRGKSNLHELFQNEMALKQVLRRIFITVNNSTLNAEKRAGKRKNVTL